MPEKMSDIDEIDYISKIDFSSGFQRFHIKWPLKNLNKPKYSSVFETAVIDGGRKITLKWFLNFGDFSEDPTHTWFGVDLESSKKITPMIYRMCLSSSTNVLFDRSKVVVIEANAGYGHDVLSTDFDEYPIDDLLLQFWIDIPNAIAIGNNRAKRIKIDSDGQNSLQMASNDDVFSRVVGKDSDESSDVTITIVNKKDEEFRRFHCHTKIMSARSEVFEKLFASEEWKENCVKDDRSLRINDISVEVMEMVLKYIYTSIFPDLSIYHYHLCGIIYAADKCNLPELKNWCVGAMILKHDSPAYRIEQLILADRHNLVQLKTVCIDQLSLIFSTTFLDPATVKDLPNHLWKEIMKAVTNRQMKTDVIILPAA